MIKNKVRCLISHQTRQVIISASIGIEESLYKLQKINSSIIPSRLNSYVLENLFCQQRTFHNGAITHPTYLGYCNTLNSVVLGHTSISKISNTGENVNENTEPSSAKKFNVK